VVPIPVVAIQVEQPPEAPEWVAQMVAACTSGVLPNRCAEASDPEAGKAEHLAYVSWLDDAEQHVLVEVGHPDKPRGHWRFQRLRFTPGDPPLDRWRAIGLTVATLVGPNEPEPAPVEISQPPPPVPEPPPVALDPEPEPEPPRPFWVAVRGVVATGFDEGPPAPGIDLRAGYALDVVPVFSVLSAGARTASHGSVVGSWWDFGVGVGAYAEPGGLRLSAAGLLMAQSLWASVESPNGNEDAGTSATLGGGVLFEVTYPSDGRVGFTLGGRGIWLRRPTVVSVAGRDSAESPQQSYAGYAGVEARF